MKKCKVKNCGSTHKVVKNYCNKHYQQFKKHGKILKTSLKDKNIIIIKHNHIEIELYNIEHKVIAKCICDKSFLQTAKKYRWGSNNYGYAKTYIEGKPIFIHNIILKRKAGFDTDHINGNKLDNRSKNLRYATRSQNNINRKGIYGIHFHKTRKKWQVYIGLNKKRIN